jgi:hypothetical protein
VIFDGTSCISQIRARERARAGARKIIFYMIKVFSMLRTLFHNGWSYAKIRSNQGYVGKVRAPARARSRARI